MKRHVQFPGIRKWSGDDLMELQGEGLSIADRFFSQYGNCVICGCTVSEGSISAGLVTIGGLVMPFETATGIEVFPVYLVKDEKHIQREYADDVVRDIAVKYFAKVVQTEPESGEYIEVPEDGVSTFFDKINAVWLSSIVKQLENLKTADKNLSDAIVLLKAADTAAAGRITALEKKMPSFLDHVPTVDDGGYGIGVEVWTVDEYGNKTFWRCHDNTEGQAVWKRSGEGSGGGSYGGAVYLTGQTDFSKATILIKEGYLK